MQLSRDEYLRVSQMGPVGGVRVADIGMIATARIQRDASPATDPTPTHEAKKAAESVEKLPDVREEIVASLRARIESGNYVVSGDTIAEMMVRRLLADRVR